MSSPSPNPSEIRQRTARLINYEDGLWDLLLGAVFMLLAIYPITRARLGPTWNLALFIGLMMVALAVQMAVRRAFAVPRLGYAKALRTPKLKVLLIVTVVLVAMTFGLVILTLLDAGWPAMLVPSAGPAWLRMFLVDIVVMLAMAGLFSALGYIFGVARLYFYGWLIGGANLASAIVYDGAPEGFNLPLGLAALLVLGVGCSLLIRFRRNYPLLSQDR